MDNEFKIAFYSDTHCRTDLIHPPESDISLVIHTGDVTENDKGNLNELEDALKYFDHFYHNTPKILIAGNHDFSLGSSSRTKEAEALLKKFGWIYLEDSGTIITYGNGQQISIWGMPYMPHSFGVFNLSDEERAQYIDRIPFNTDILLTHCGPYGILSGGKNKIEFGDDLLLNRLSLLKNLRLHAFGHIHESYGTLCSDGKLFVNSALGSDQSKPILVSWPHLRIL